VKRQQQGRKWVVQSTETQRLEELHGAPYW